MGNRSINPRRARIHLSYTVEEAAKALGVHPNTVRAMTRSGLPVLNDKKPIMIHGGELRRFLEARRTTRKRNCAAGELFCFKCRLPRKPALGMVDFVPKTPSYGTLKALCESCGTPLNRHVRTAKIGATMPGIAVRLSGPDSHLSERISPPLNCSIDETTDDDG